MKKIALYTSIVYTLFISIFALDELGNSLLGFLIHLIPSFILIVTTFIANNNPKIGSIIFFAMFALFTIFFNTYREIISFLLISAPVLVISILFYLTNRKNPTKE